MPWPQTDPGLVERELELVLTVATSTGQTGVKTPPVRVGAGQSVAISVLAALREPTNQPRPPATGNLTLPLRLQVDLPDGQV